MSLQQRMRISRENAGLNQEEMAKKIGIGRATYAKTEQGVRELRRGELLAIAAITGVDSHWLETGEVPEAGEN
ncbi:HTH family transcriptional regulator [Corynebacterium matruchotii]|uniref:helix-turn-helix transcriptional regulator n=1 Tax=Corynebacterium matruchotii TaxID=43768 RepID=UPI000F6F131D|nr:helix-turn-helix transcriptional regulator [Corynebacterium matruchotii]VEI98665.1 HTH family transcriptional regulator [Corynebacterium matruchotii]